MSYSKPDFLGIGFAKSGTSWVFKQLNSHPDVDIPELKELRYFLENWHIPKASWSNKLFSKHWHYVRYRTMLKKKVKGWIAHPRWFMNDHWYRKFLLKGHSDAWYSSLFDPHKIAGEITPGYVFMCEEQVSSLSKRFPDLKIIIMLRNPVERTWSHIKMNLGKHQSRKVTELGEEEMMERMRYILDLTPHYVDCISIWKQYFEHVFIGYQDDLSKRPVELAMDLQRFLGLTEQVPNIDLAQKPINQGLSGDMPEKMKAYLSDYFRESNKKLYEKLGNDNILNW